MQKNLGIALMTALFAAPSFAAPAPELPTVTTVLFVPIVLSSSGLGGAFFTSELGLTNRGSTDASISYAYTAAFGGSSGTASDSLQAGHQKILPDAITFLKSLGIPLGDSGNRGGTLRITFTGLSSADAGAATVRTTTSVAEGRAGLAYAGLPSSRLLAAPVYLCGLRQNATDRSNVAVMHAGGPSEGDITLRVTVVSGDPANPRTQALPDIPLSPGGFNQISGILASDGLTLTNGYVKIERISGTAPFYAYGVVNDQANSDGSFVEPVVASPVTAVTGATLPVVVETSAFSTEAVLTNFTSSARTVRCTYAASALPGGSVSFDIPLLPNEQQILPDFVQVLRDRGVIRGARGPTFAGALFATDATGDLRGISIGARTSAAGGGGRYGLFYSAVGNGTEAETAAWLYGLQQNADNRTNLALVNVGSTDSSPDVFRIDLYDGGTSHKTATVDDVSVPARGFLQINTILAQYAPGVPSGYAHVTRTSGSNPFIAYAVVNDGGQPGQRSGDGAFVAAERDCSVGGGCPSSVEFSMTTPYVNSSDIASINEAFSSTATAPWGFAHNGIDFSPAGNLKPFQAVSSGTVEMVQLFQNGITSNWQVNVRIRYDSNYAAEYAFEPFSTSQTDGQSQLANIFVSPGQKLSEGDVIGKLYVVDSAAAHVHFGLYKDGTAVCPREYFTPAAADSVLQLIHRDHPSWNMCY